MEKGKHKKIIISGGGTGGHIFPAISVANALKKMDPGIEILFVGAEGRMEMEKVPAAGYKIIGLPVSGFHRKKLLENVVVLCRLLKSLSRARKILKEFMPDVAVGVGGYASGPVLREAGKMGIPILIQEQNSSAGVTNRLLAQKASVICVAYDGMEEYFPAERIIKTGNPVRLNFDNLRTLREEALRFFGLDEKRPVILTLGGSLGAGSINQSLKANLTAMKNSGYQWLWQTGVKYFESMNEPGVAGSFTGFASVHGFLNRMDYAYAVADIIISRAGAGTISELCLVGKPVILVPSPNVAGDHQAKNAMSLAKRQAALVVADNDAMKKLVNAATELVPDTAKREMLSRNIKLMADRDADTRIAIEVLKLAKK